MALDLKSSQDYEALRPCQEAKLNHRQYQYSNIFWIKTKVNKSNNMQWLQVTLKHEIKEVLDQYNQVIHSIN